MAAGGRALLGANMLLCPLQPRSASGEPRGHGRAGPSAALWPGGSAASSSSSSSTVAAAASLGHCPPRLLPARGRHRPFPSSPPPPPPSLLSPRLPPPAAPVRRSALPDLRSPPAVVRAQREFGNSWRGREKVLVQTSATVATLLGFPVLPCRQSRPVRPCGAPILPTEPWPGIWSEGEEQE